MSRLLGKLSGSGSMKVAAMIQLVSKYASILAQLIVTAVLSRLVTPEEYGLMAIVTVFTAFFIMFTDMGLGVAIVQFRDLTERDFGSLFAVSSFFGAILSTLFCIASIPISLFYGSGELIGLCCAAAPSLLFSCMNMVPNGLMLREKRFAGIGIRLVASNVVSGAIAIALAFFGWGAYALVAQTVLSTLFVLLWNLSARHVHEINLHFGKVLRKVFSYSANQFGFSFLNYFARNLDRLVIGRVLGSQQLAFYDRAYKLTTYPMNSLSSVVASVIQPFMAEHQDEKDVLGACWWRVTRLLSLVGAPITAILVGCSKEVTLLFYGGQWGEAVPLLQVLSISVYFQMIGNPSGAFYQSAGRTDRMFQAGIINTLLTVGGLVGGLALGGLQGAAFGISLSYCLHMVTMYYYLLKGILGISAGELVSFIPEIATAAAVCLLCFFMGSFLSGASLLISGGIKFLLILIVFIIVYKTFGITSLFRQLLHQ